MRIVRVGRPELVVGIDQSYTGFAICALERDGRHCTTVDSFSGKGVDRLSAIGIWLKAFLGSRAADVQHICMEDYARGRLQWREEAGELGAVVKLALRTMPGLEFPRCYPTIVAPTSLKKFVTGNGGAKKSDVKLHVYKRWGAEFSDDNKADSYGLARIAAALQWPEGQELTKVQNDVLAKLRPYTER